MAERSPGQREVSLRLDLLGGFALHDAKGQEIAIRSKKAQALLAFLALSAGRPQARAKLTSLLWSNRGEAQARSSLRQSLSELRKALPDLDRPLFTAGRDDVHLDPDIVVVDAVTLVRLVDEGTAEALAEAGELYRGDLLDGLDVRDAEFEEWRSAEGERLRARVLEALGRLLSQQTGDDAITTARRSLALDPLDEATHRALMRLYAAAGDRSLAVKQYEACRQLLGGELGLEPEAETKELFEDIRRGAGEGERLADPVPMETPRASEPPPLPDKPSIAVLPFTNMSGDPEQDYFSDGITEDIIAELSRFRSLFVIARDSCFTFKGRVIKAQDVGRDLGVAYLARGSVRKAGNRLRVTIQLVNAADGETVWAERYDRELADVFAIQDEIAETIAAMIGGRLEAEDRQRASRHTHPTAYDYVLRAQALYYQVSRAANTEAAPLAEKAIKHDPDNARAHMLLAAIHGMDYLESWSRDPQRSLDLALQLGQKAISLDDADSLAHAQLGEILSSHGRFSEAEWHFDKALALNPNDVEARAIYGAWAGGERGLEALKFAERMNPCSFIWIPWIKGTILYELRRYDEAIAALAQIDSRITSARGWLAASLAQAGRSDEAQATLREYLEAAKKDYAIFPKSSAEWESLWRREGQYQHEEDFEHLREGLRKAGLDI
jgi:TolB-like protein/DNA-binding SARP family transcriptional activator/Flp pilus assembly protein TadD